jgi:hypothetical protein
MRFRVSDGTSVLGWFTGFPSNWQWLDEWIGRRSSSATLAAPWPGVPTAPLSWVWRCSNRISRTAPQARTRPCQAGFATHGGAVGDRRGMRRLAVVRPPFKAGSPPLGAPSRWSCNALGDPLRSPCANPKQRRIIFYDRRFREIRRAQTARAGPFQLGLRERTPPMLNQACRNNWPLRGQTGFSPAHTQQSELLLIRAHTGLVAGTCSRISNNIVADGPPARAPHLYFSRMAYSLATASMSLIELAILAAFSSFSAISRVCLPFSTKDAICSSSFRSTSLTRLSSM